MTTENTESYRLTARQRIKLLLDEGQIAEATRLQYGYVVGSVMGRLAWGTMTYACEGNETSTGCGHERKVYLCLGVEGPAPLRDEDEYVPAPFVAGTCPRCQGRLTHVRWSEDEDWWPRLEVIPDDAARFAIPSPSKAEEYAAVHYGGAQLLEPGDFR